LVVRKDIIKMRRISRFHMLRGFQSKQGFGLVLVEGIG
jgi:hypothetical protein